MTVADEQRFLTAERVAGAGTSFRCGVFVRCEKCGITVHPIGYRRHVKNCTGDSRRILRRPCPKCGIWFGNSGYRKHVNHCGFEKKRVKKLIRTDKRRISSELLRKRKQFNPVGPDAEAQRKIEIESIRSHLGKRKRHAVIAEPEKIRKRLRGKQKPGPEWRNDEALPAPRPVQVGGSSSSSAPTVPLRVVRLRRARAVGPVPEAPNRFKNKTSSTNNCPYCGKKGGVGEHRYLCLEAPWHIWSGGGYSRFLRKYRNVDTSTFPYECKHCHIHFDLKRSFTIHAATCERRRAKSGLEPSSLWHVSLISEMSVTCQRSLFPWSQTSVFSMLANTGPRSQFHERSCCPWFLTRARSHVHKGGCCAEI